MDLYLIFAITSCFPIILTILFLLIDKYTTFLKQKNLTRQVLIGLVFGFIIILQICLGNDQGNGFFAASDAAPLCAGLIFGGPAGIISGVIGGVFRFVAGFWGTGVFTSYASAITIIIAGIYAAILRKYLFDKELPSPLIAFCIGVVIEAVHNLLYILTNPDKYAEALNVISSTSLPILIAVSLCITISIVIAYYMTRQKQDNKREKKKNKKLKTLHDKIQVNLMIAFVCALVFTVAFTFVVQYGLAVNSATALMRLNVSDTQQEVRDQSDDNLLRLCEKVKKDFVLGSELHAIKKKYDIAEINYINDDGIIRMSTNGNFIGYDMRSGEQSAEFMKVLEEGGSMVQEYGPISYDETIKRKYAATSILTGGMIQIGYDAKQFQNDINERIKSAADNRHIGNTGFMVITNDEEVLSAPDDFYATDFAYSVQEAGNIQENEVFSVYSGDTKCLALYEYSEGYYIFALMPYKEAFASLNETIILMGIILILIFAILYLIVYSFIKKSVLKNLGKVGESLDSIADGNLEVVVNVRDNKEFDTLSNDINTTVATLKGYTEKIRENYEKDMLVAKNIQASVLPSALPFEANHPEIDLSAFMATAKEVGGDFYDFYWISYTELLVMVADVSGKGVPAAMFMMRAKTLIREAQEKGATLDEALTKINNQLCEGNDAGMFVTAWIAVIDVTTGHVEYVSAGHNPPAMMHKNEDFSYIRGKSGFVLAGMEDYKYKIQEFDITPGTILYLYTDGVTEATDSNNQLYGEERLIDCLNSNKDMDMKNLCDAVKADIDLFVGSAPQFDDITMVAIKLKHIVK